MSKLQPGEFITSYEQMYHGMPVTCTIENEIIKDAKISISCGSDSSASIQTYFICQNHRDGWEAQEKFGYRYSWNIGHPKNNNLPKFLSQEYVSELRFAGLESPKTQPTNWVPHYTKDGHQISQDKIKLASGKEYTLAELQAELNLLRSISNAHKKFFPSSK